VIGLEQAQNVDGHRVAPHLQRLDTDDVGAVADPDVQDLVAGTNLSEAFDLGGIGLDQDTVPPGQVESVAVAAEDRIVRADVDIGDRPLDADHVEDVVDHQVLALLRIGEGSEPSVVGRIEGDRAAAHDGSAEPSDEEAAAHAVSHALHEASTTHVVEVSRRSGERTNVPAG
jgi:hypothetical protein